MLLTRLMIMCCVWGILGTQLAMAAEWDERLVNAPVIGLLDVGYSHAEPLQVKGEHAPEALMLFEEVSNLHAPLVIPADAARSAMAMREYSYEQPGLSVYAIKDVGDEHWYQVRYKHQPYWLQHKPAYHFHPYPELVTGSLAYIQYSSGALAVEPGGEMVFSQPFYTAFLAHSPEVPVTNLRWQEVDGVPWFYVEVQDTSPCEGSAPPQVVAKGWMPGYAPMQGQFTGQNTLWFYARGC